MTVCVMYQLCNNKFFIHIIASITVILILTSELINNNYDVNIPSFNISDNASENINSYYDIIPNRLVNLNDFEYLINVKPCSKREPILLIIIVASALNHYEHRRVIRNTWGQQDPTTRIIFLVGAEDFDATALSLLSIESKLFGDIIQGSFIDDYHNMTYKHVMGLKWVTNNCANAKYILKVDDDLVLNPFALRYYLVRQLSPWGATNMILCAVSYDIIVARNPYDLYYISKEEYPFDAYPTYCRGFAILYSPDIVFKLLKASFTSKFVWIDDIFVTGIAAGDIGQQLTNICDLVLLSASNLTLDKALDHGPFLFGPYNLYPNDMIAIWDRYPRKWIWNYTDLTLSPSNQYFNSCTLSKARNIGEKRRHKK